MTIHRKHILIGVICFFVAMPLMGERKPQLSSDEQRLLPTTKFNQIEEFEVLSGGATTHSKVINANAFSHSSANMAFKRELDFKVGNAFFRRLWVSSPSSTQASDGLGPIFNARACQRCHIKDGRGHPPENNEDNSVSILLKLSIPPQNEEQEKELASGKISSINDSYYGGQLQDRSVIGVEAEGKLHIGYTEQIIKLNGNETASLRKPKVSLKNLQNHPLHNDIMTSLRVAPQMIGLGLLESIAEADITRQEDINDLDGDGISGKANRVWSEQYQKVMLGRFGLKAGKPTLNDQNQAAFNNDIGLSTPLFKNPYGDCTTAQIECLNMPNGNSQQHENLEVNTEIANLVLHYTRNLAVPPRRNADAPAVLAGKKHFYQSGCIACHTPKYITPRETEQPEQARQLIWPYTDLLLHDMGEGLADFRPEGKANGYEWRTPPLWGIGLTPVVNGHSYYLHDGRARNLLEAVLWHGGEAEKAKNKVVMMTSKERRELILFLESL